MHFHVDGAAVQGRNIRWTSLLTMGESWHNNHHAYPGSARLGLAAGEWDPGWWVLVLLCKAGLVRNLRLPAHLPTRDELRTLGPVPMVDSPVAVAGIGWLWRNAAAGGTTMSRIEFPGIHVRADLLQRVATVPVVCNIGARRLAASVEGQVVQGLPCLWLALARRSAAHRVMLAAALPVVVLAEHLRASVTLAQSLKQ